MDDERQAITMLTLISRGRTDGSLMETRGQGEFRDANVGSLQGSKISAVIGLGRSCVAMRQLRKRLCRLGATASLVLGFCGTGAQFHLMPNIPCCTIS